MLGLGATSICGVSHVLDPPTTLQVLPATCGSAGLAGCGWHSQVQQKHQTTLKRGRVRVSASVTGN